MTCRVLLFKTAAATVHIDRILFEKLPFLNPPRNRNQQDVDPLSNYEKAQAYSKNQSESPQHCPKN